MDVNLIQLLGEQFGDDVVGEISGMLGEPENKVKQAVGGLGPVLVTALADKASSGEGLDDLLKMFQSSEFDGSQSLNLSSLLGSEGGGLSALLSAGAPLVVSLLGDRRGSVAEWLAAAAGISPKSAASLLSLAAPVLLNLIGGQAKKSGGLNPAALGELLSSQGAALRGKVPDDLASALGVADLSRIGLGQSLVRPQPDEAVPPVTRLVRPEPEAQVEPKRQEAPPPVTQLRRPEPEPKVEPQRQEAPPPVTQLRRPEPQAKSGASWWPWVIIALIVIALLLWWFVGRGPA